MIADPRFVSRPPRFWAHAKYLSEKVGYSDRGTKQLRSYGPVQAVAALRELNLAPDNDLLADVLTYLNWRAERLNNHVAPLFMNREQAAVEFEKVKKRVLPTKAASMNKQKGEKRHPSYLASIVGMIAESVVGSAGFVDDARRLAILTWDGNLEEIFSRRFDGALPSTENPTALWEIKEYYGTTTFGSRVADGVYETLLDGYEIEGVRTRHGRNIHHFLFIDDRFTWWDCGRSYLCRMIDMLHTGHVDEIFFGREVLTDWEPRLRSLIKG
jgi:hypothetical protein